MKERFEGTLGRPRLIDALKQHRIVLGDESIAAAFADIGTLVELAPQAVLLMQGAFDNHAYFLLAGEVDVNVNGRPVAVRGPQDLVGEMALIDPSAPRSATLICRSPVVALRVEEPGVRKLAEQYPVLWRHIALRLGERLRERSKLIRPPNTIPRLFIGCSTEALAVAQEIQAGLKFANVAVTIWPNRVFGASGVPVDGLLKEAEASDFALFVFSPDDKVTSRSADSDAPRDNVVFEMGMFLGVLGRERTMMIHEHGLPLKIPSDLLGITPVTYVRHPGADLSATLGPACTDIRLKIESFGVR